jgi:hypothetical protein
MKTIRSILLLTSLLLAGATFAQTSPPADSTGNRPYGALVDQQLGRVVVKAKYYGDEKPRQPHIPFYQQVATYKELSTLQFKARTGCIVLVAIDQNYDNDTDSWYMVWADAQGKMHAKHIFAQTAQ